jgi:hypothetical protein
LIVTFDARLGTKVLAFVFSRGTGGRDDPTPVDGVAGGEEKALDGGGMCDGCVG